MLGSSEGPTVLRLWSHLDQVDRERRGGLEDALIPIEFAVEDSLEAGVRDHLEARPTRRSRDVDARVVDPGAVLRRLDDRVRFGVDGPDAVTVLHHVVVLVAVSE